MSFQFATDTLLKYVRQGDYNLQALQFTTIITIHESTGGGAKSYMQWFPSWGIELGVFWTTWKGNLEEQASVDT